MAQAPALLHVGGDRGCDLHTALEGPVILVQAFAAGIVVELLLLRDWDRGMQPIQLSW